MKKYISKIIGIFDEEAYFIRIPDELLKELDWKSGDTVEWILNDYGSYTVRKVK